MSNTANKIFILTTVSVLAVAGILVFYPTMVAPPDGISTENLHIKDISSCLSDFSSQKTDAYNDRVYDIVTDKIELYRKEGFLIDDERDYQVKALAQKYIPIFVASCYKKFNASSWRESDHTAMRKRIKELKGLTVDNGNTKIVTGSFLTDLGNIEGIIDTYNEAKKVAAYASFVSVSDANNKIAEAEIYSNAPYVKNCAELVNKLASVKVRIGENHYAYVEGQVVTLRNYCSISKDVFKGQANSVNGKIQEYENNKTKYGASAKDPKVLRDKAAELYREAMAYYEKPEINVNTNGQWSSYASPYSSYHCYQSTSNWHKANSNATMSFTIKGYNSFTFKIRSNGEAHYDYVMVALDKLPARGNNYSSTQGSSSVFTYKDVTFSGLDKSLTYTIYVTYTKDSSNDSGLDRGYVLIPYVTN